MAINTAVASGRCIALVGGGQYEVRTVGRSGQQYRLAGPRAQRKVRMDPGGGGAQQQMGGGSQQLPRSGQAQITLQGSAAARRSKSLAAGTGSRTQAHVCMRPGCSQPTYNGQPHEYCSRTCRAADMAAAGAATSSYQTSSALALAQPVITTPRFLDFVPPTGSPSSTFLAFYFPDKEEPCDRLCGCSFLGNFFATPVQMEEGTFRNAEAAFQALKFPRQYVPQFENLTGDQAFKLKRQLEQQGLDSRSFGKYRSNWNAMLKVLAAKFSSPQMLKYLLQTRDAFLLEHNSVLDRDKVWSNNSDGEGWNWLGLQLMLIREERRGSGPWTPRLPREGDFGGAGSLVLKDWQDLVRAATKALLKELDQSSPGGFRAGPPGGAARGCGQAPLYAGQPPLQAPAPAARGAPRRFDIPGQALPPFSHGK